MVPLTHDEAALLYHVQMYGSNGYPLVKRGRQWWINEFRSWRGFPVPFKTKKAAQEQFERWMELARDRWREMKRDNPELLMTAVGIRGLPPQQERA